MNPDEMAEVYVRRDRIVIAPLAKWDDFGAWGSAGKLERLDATVTDHELGSAVRRAIESGVERELVREPMTALFRAVGVRSHASLVRVAANVTCYRHGDELLVVPNSRAPGGGGWVEGDSLTLDLATASDELVGVTVRRARDLCSQHRDPSQVRSARDEQVIA